MQCMGCFNYYTRNILFSLTASNLEQIGFVLASSGGAGVWGPSIPCGYTQTGTAGFAPSAP